MSWIADRPLYYRLLGKSVEPTEEPQVQDKSRWRVAEHFTDEHWISTVFLGVDHAFSGPPQIFETMVFLRRPGKPEEDTDLETERYASWQEAEEGHNRMVAKYTKPNVIEGDYRILDLKELADGQA